MKTSDCTVHTLIRVRSLGSPDDAEGICPESFCTVCGMAFITAALVPDAPHYAIVKAA